nr:MAG TPA: Putative tail protein [Herelleviridae sp.]
MDILLKPDALSMTGAMNHFVISTSNEITFVLKYADSNQIIVQHTYTPNKAKRIEVDMENIITPLLSFQLQDSTTPYRQKNIARIFTVEITEDKSNNIESCTFTALRAGIDSFADTATNWLKANFLTWQPTMKPVTYYTPEFLTYYAVEDCVVKCRAYIDNNGEYEPYDLTLANLSSASCWTIPLQYGIIAGKLNKLPSYYDVWVEDNSGTRFTYIQRYYATDIRNEQEQWVLFENSLGGIDTFRAYGNAENTAKHTHNIVEIENDAEEYRVDTTREFKKNTGSLSDQERKWLLDFFPALGKYLYIGNHVRRIVVMESEVSWQEKELPSSYTFTYKYADARPYLNLKRIEQATPHELKIKIPDIGSFTIAPRLVELERLPLSGGALFPVQSPYADKWNITTADAILAWISREITAAYKGDGSFGHQHDNMSVLKALDRTGNYLTLDAHKISAALADLAEVAKKLQEDSPDWQKIVRTDKDSIVRAVISFMTSVLFGNYVKEASGAAIYPDAQGNWHFEGDYFHVRKQLTAEELQLMKSTHINGKVCNTPGSFTISKVERINGGWRCYFTRQDGEGRMVSNTMGMDDYAYCETFNLVSEQGARANHYYHRRVFGLGTDYVDICDNTNAEDYASGSDEPRIGDEVSTLGNKTNPARQHAIIQSAAGTGSPYYRMYVGINSFSLPKPKIQMSPTGSWWMVTDEHGHELSIEEYLASLKSQINAVEQQSDKQMVLWFGDEKPSLRNAPALEWQDDFTRSEHVNDIYYNRSFAKTGGGRAYAFTKTDSDYTWEEITDADVLTSLEAANRAQDTADGKRRVFVAQPTVQQEYEEGDLWVNATYKDENVEYSNDALRAIVAKKNGEPFSITHWKPVQQYTTKPISAIKQLAGKTVQAIAGNENTLNTLLNAIASGKGTSLLTMQGRFNAVVSSLTGTSDLVHSAVWDDEGNLLGFRNVGMLRSVAGEDGSLTLFSNYYDAAGTKKHSASFRLTTNSDGSSLLFDADQINFLGKTVINGKFIVDKLGNVTMNNFTANDANITGNVIARTGRIGGFTIEDDTLLWQQTDYFGHKSRGLHLGVSQESDSAVVDVFFNAATKGTFGVRAIGGNAGGAAIFGSQYTTGEEQYTKPNMNEYYAGFFCGNVCCTDSVFARKFFVLEKDYAAAGAKGWEGIDFDYNIDLDHYRLQVRGGIIVGLKRE